MIICTLYVYVKLAHTWIHYIYVVFSSFYTLTLRGPSKCIRRGERYFSGFSGVREETNVSRSGERSE